MSAIPIESDDNWTPAKEAEGYADCAQGWLEYPGPKGKQQDPLTVDQAYEFAQANALLAIRAELRHLADVIEAGR